MPVENAAMSIGCYQDTIHIVGGEQQQGLLIKYNITNNSFVSITDFFPKPLYSYSQWWFQMNNILYMTGDTQGQMINTYNLVTNQFNNISFTIPRSVRTSGCLTGDPLRSLLYHLGGSFENNGRKHLDIVQILDVSDGSWSTGANMNIKRGLFSCAVSNNNLYAIAGHNMDEVVFGDGRGRLSSIEYIVTTNIVHNAWRYADNITEPTDWTRSAMYNENIFIIGGWTAIGQTSSDVYILNSITNKISVSNNRLRYAVLASAPVVIHQTLFLFGGYRGLEYYDEWQYIAISEVLNQPTASQSPTTAEPTTVYPTTANPTTANQTKVEVSLNISTSSDDSKIAITKDGEVDVDVDILKSTASEADQESTENADVTFFVILVASVTGLFICGKLAVGIYIVCRGRCQQKVTNVNVSNIANSNIDIEPGAIKEENPPEVIDQEDPEKITNKYMEESMSISNDQKITTKTVDDNIASHNDMSHDSSNDNIVEGRVDAVNVIALPTKTEIGEERGAVDE